MGQDARTVVTRCSLVIRPVDIWTGKPPAGSALRVRLEESDRRPIRTSDGSYAFLDYPGRRCTVVIGSPNYLQAKLTVNLDDFEPLIPIVTAGLLPNRIYPPPAAASGFVFRITDAAGSPLGGAQVSAYMDDEGAVRGRLADEKTAKGARSLRIAAGSGRLLPGDVFVMKTREGHEEWGTVSEVSEPDSVLSLEQPLSKAWSRGARLLPAVRTRSDHDGSVVLPLRGHLPPACAVTVDISLGNRRHRAVWTSESGSVIRLPDVRLIAD